MRTIPASDILTGVAAKAGLDITDSGLAALQRPTILPWLENLGDYLRIAWDSYPWPDLMTVEQRYFFQGPWASGTTVPAGKTVYHAAAYWTAKLTTTAEPVAGAAWEVLNAETRVYHLPFAPLFYNPIGTIHAMSNEDLRLVGRHANPVQFNLVDGDGYYVPRRQGDRVWIAYKGVCPEFRMWFTGYNWAKGAGCYDPSTGRFFRATAALTNNSSLASGWEAYEFPALFRRYLTLKVFATWLRSERRLDEGAVASNQAEAALDAEIRRLLDQGLAQPVRYLAT